MKCSKCQSELLPGASFCRECGQKVTPQVSFCRNCGNKVEENSMFCSKCGTRLLLTEQNNADNSQPVNLNNNNYSANAVSQPVVNPDNGAYTSSSPSQHGVNLRGNNTAAPSDEFSDKLKRALLKFWNSIDTFCKAVTVFSVVVVLLLVGALIANKNYPIIISVIQALALTAAVLLNKNVIKVKKSWIKYIVLVGAAALTVLNVKSFSFVQKKEEVPQSNPHVEQDIATSTETIAETTDETSAAIDSPAVEQTIESGTEYSYMVDGWNIYIATSVSDSVIEVKNWSKFSKLETDVSENYVIGSYRINDVENEFKWLDEEHTAFSLKLKDTNNSKLKFGEVVTFTIDTSNSNTNKGTNYNKDIACYSYTNDDWNDYRAIALTSRYIKIERWSRAMSIDLVEHLFSGDVCIIDTLSSDTDFKWTDDAHTGFTITMNDPENESYWDGNKLVTFMLENEKYTYNNVYSYMNKLSDNTAENTQESSTAPIETAQESGTSPTESAQESNTSLGKNPQKNGFSPTGNIRVIVGNYVFDVPSYWKSDIHEKDRYRAYAETSGKVAMLEISANYDEEDTVTYDILKRETDEGLMAAAIESWFDECHVKKTDSFDNGRIKGFVYHVDFVNDELSGTGSVLYYPSESDNKWMSVSLTQTDNTEYSYDNDVEKIMKSITPKASYSENISVPTTQSSGNYTIDSCKDLAKILSMKETLAPEYSDFATKYRGAVIEFDANVADLCNHEGYNTRYDLLIFAGNYDPNHQTGLQFKFENVSMPDMKADDTIRVGDNVRIEAKVVKFDSNSELFYLDPVSVKHR